jgi:hypothetical protein
LSSLENACVNFAGRAAEGLIRRSPARNHTITLMVQNRDFGVFEDLFGPLVPPDDMFIGIYDIDAIAGVTECVKVFFAHEPCSLIPI